MAEWHAQGSSRVPQPRLRSPESGGLHRPPLRLLSLRQAEGKQGKRGGRKPDRDALAAASALQFMLPQASGQRLRVLRVFFTVCQACRGSKGGRGSRGGRGASAAASTRCQQREKYPDWLPQYGKRGHSKRSAPAVCTGSLSSKNHFPATPVSA